MAHREEIRFLEALKKRRETLKSDLVEKPLNGSSEDIARKYREQVARIDELDKVEGEARRIFQGED